MHTTETLILGHFQCVRAGREPEPSGDLTVLLPAFSDADRIGVVSPNPVDGIRDAGYAVLACVTAFYAMRQGELHTTCLYPQYFAFHAPGQPAADAWGELDIWPASQWVGTDGTVQDLLAKALAHGVSRLFWPATLFPLRTQLQASIREAASTQLRSILLYGGQTEIQLRVAEPAEELVRKAIDRLPGLAPNIKHAFTRGRADHQTASSPGYVEGYRALTADDFMNQSTA